MAYWPYCGKISRGDGMIISAGQHLNKSDLMSLYYSFIYPYFTYFNNIWGDTYKTRLKQLVMLQNKAVRILSHAGNRTHSDPMYKKLDIMKVENFNMYLIGRFMFCVSIDKVPQSFKILFRKKTMNITPTVPDFNPSFTYTFCEIKLK